MPEIVDYEGDSLDDIGGVDAIIQTLKQNPEHPREYVKQIRGIEPSITSYYDQVGGLDQSKVLNDPEIFVVGDIHARSNSLAKTIEKIRTYVEAQGKNLDEELLNRRIVFAFVGDLVHSEKNRDDYQAGKTSGDRRKIIRENLNTILGVMKLKTFYPGSVFVVKGNHDDAATESGLVGKMGIDQGASLQNALKKHDLVKPVTNILSKLPIVAAIHSKTGQHLIISHALPIGSYSELLERANQSTQNYTPASNRVEPIDTALSQEDLLNLIKRPTTKIKNLFTWSKVKDPFQSPTVNLPIESELFMEEDKLKEQVNKSVYIYLSRFLSRTFGRSKSGKEINPRDLLWIIGHEDRSGLSRNIANWFNPDNPNRLKIFQINDQHKLPTVRVKFSELTTSRNVIETLKKNVRKV
jgi:hypothetical protein